MTRAAHQFHVADIIKVKISIQITRKRKGKTQTRKKL
jgi:hypothetical protein